MNYLELFLIIFKINAITFGGGFTIAPIIKDEFSNKRKLISEEDILNIIALSQSGPGALAVSTAFLTGYKIKGPIGGLVALIAAILPPLIIISIIFIVYKEFSDNNYVRAALRGMSGVISAVLVITSIQLAKQSIKKHKVFSSLLIITAFSISYFTTINTALIIIALGLIGLFTFSFFKEEQVI